MKSETNIILEKIKIEVNIKTGKNIKSFKSTFLERRILHRMRIVGITDYEEYLKLISTSLNEVNELYSALSINVTKFFRDPQVWGKLESEIIPNLTNKSNTHSIQVWSCGSASGEEPYSIGILLNEVLKSRGIKFEIFANDISLEAITRSKKGIYRKANLVNVKEDKIFRYFEKIEDEQYQIKPTITSQIKFENTDMLKITKKQFDIIFCRNVLIYYDRNLHEVIFEKFANSLKDNGILILGQDESMVGTYGSKYFTTIYPKERIYQKTV